MEKRESKNVRNDEIFVSIKLHRVCLPLLPPAPLPPPAPPLFCYTRTARPASPLPPPPAHRRDGEDGDLIDDALLLTE